MRSQSITRRASLAAVALLLVTATSWIPARAAERVRVALLAYGTASWELDVMQRHGLAAAEGVELAAREYASPQATLIALQGGETDLAITDWLWVARQRGEGRSFTFVPYSTAVGSLMVPADSPIRTLADLRGKRIGIAGGPLDKNWLVTRALVERETGVDPASTLAAVYGAPPLLSAQLQQGRLDGVITHWPYAARLGAAGFRTLLETRQAIRALGITAEVPMIGYVFDEHWAGAHGPAARGFFRAVERAERLLKESDQEWEAVRPLMGVTDEASFRALRDGYRGGIPGHWGAAERQAAGRLFEVLRGVGGSELVGQATSLPVGTFWDGVGD